MPLRAVGAAFVRSSSVRAKATAVETYSHSPTFASAATNDSSRSASKTPSFAMRASSALTLPGETGRRGRSCSVLRLRQIQSVMRNMVLWNFAAAANFQTLNRVCTRFPSKTSSITTFERLPRRLQIRGKIFTPQSRLPAKCAMPWRCAETHSRQNNDQLFARLPVRLCPVQTQVERPRAAFER
jgi:hypothetical protein